MRLADERLRLLHRHALEGWRAAGETEQRTYGLSAWREAPYYLERERAALAWAEVVTNISQTHASDEEYEAARAQFSEEELVKLTMAVIAINGWNRLLHRLPAGGREISTASESKSSRFDAT